MVIPTKWLTFERIILKIYFGPQVYGNITQQTQTKTFTKSRGPVDTSKRFKKRVGRRGEKSNIKWFHYTGIVSFYLKQSSSDL